MQKNLTTKTVVIVVTILLCIFGIIGIPKSKAELMNNVQGEHPARARSERRQPPGPPGAGAGRGQSRSRPDHRAAEGRAATRPASITPVVDRNDPTRIEDADSIQINIKGVNAQKTSAFRSLVNDHFPTWVLTPVNSTDYRMNLKPSELLALKRDTVERSIQTISNRINKLGLTEPTVQQHGRADAEFEILVQLPGVDDPARVKEIIGTAAVLEIDEVKDGPFPSQEAALAKHGGILPLNTKLRAARRRAANRARAGIWWRAIR